MTVAARKKVTARERHRQPTEDCLAFAAHEVPAGADDCPNVVALRSPGASHDSPIGDGSVIGRARAFRSLVLRHFPSSLGQPSRKVQTRILQTPIAAATSGHVLSASPSSRRR